MGAPEFVTFSNLIIDDIVLSDGRSFMNTLGGAGTHALSGMRPWSDRLGFVAYVGSDLDPAHRATLEAMGVDTRGVLLREAVPTPRAWQLFEPDERRIEIFRTRMEDFETHKPMPDELPVDYLAARGFHIQWGGPADQVALIERLRAANPAVTLACEPALPELGATLEASLPVIRAVDLFAPDRDESLHLLGTTTISTIFERFLELGARMLALRMGAAGSLVGTAAGEFYRVPAVPPSQLVDVTGAGNAYCGGFLVGLAQGEEPAAAAARAAASASFALEQLGAPHFSPARLLEAEQRRAWALERVERLRSLADLDSSA